MNRPRISIRAIMALVIFMALGSAALRSASPLWASAIFTLTLGVLATAVLGALFSRPSRPFWTRFALFGLGYLMLVFGPWFGDSVKPYLLSTKLIAMGSPEEFSVAGFLSGTVSSPPAKPVPMKVAFNRIHVNQISGLSTQGSPVDFERIGHSLFALLAALLGGVIARSFASGSRDAV